MNNLQIFNFNGLDVRTVLIDGEPYFVGKDVAEVLGYRNTRDALKKHVDNEDKKSEIVNSSQLSQNATGYQNIDLITESGVYSLIFGSKLPTAKKFKHWVTSEVLPAIREHGAYMTDEKAFDVVNNKAGLADLLQQAADQLKQKDIQIAEMKPKALFADSVATSNSTILVGELAKILRGNGIEIGQNRLFDWLRKNGYLISKKGSSYNLPTQKSMNLGLFKIKETTINHSNGSVSISKTAKVTGKGQQYFINKFLNAEEHSGYVFTGDSETEVVLTTNNEPILH
ncbi:phage antirepressor protein [Lactobacillus jensenii 1153]|uniref:phage repressor protein/antirepressor Ant n=1 Tax=Lactobacillus jensenii TaxID=109790 RepID=UPI0001A57E80|nr:phage repressor protein/antirepressor Ant [Lactobacillus jensenii]EEQ24707.1 phage antirepressor protein [Lactobacillus jensenii 269-3]EFR61324.1 phage antirepressor protein [Lactobacillus jensenii 1153]